MTQRDAQDHWVTRLLRFVCGAVFGRVFGVYIAGRDVSDGLLAVAVILAVSIICGWLSERYGMESGKRRAVCGGGYDVAATW